MTMPRPATWTLVKPAGLWCARVALAPGEQPPVPGDWLVVRAQSGRVREEVVTGTVRAGPGYVICRTASMP
jgi:hypothetical protein